VPWWSPAWASLVEDALDEVADRMQSRDFLWVVMAIRIQRQVGGNLAELLTTVAATLREREQLRRQVQVLSAEGRLSAWILGLLPVLFGLYLLITNPEYLSPLISDVLGWIMLGVGAVLMLVGTLWMRKIVNVEV
jgi:tight adherence protein B